MAKFFKYDKIAEDFDYDDDVEIEWIAKKEQRHNAKLISTSMYSGTGPLGGTCEHTVYYFRTAE